MSEFNCHVCGGPHSTGQCVTEANNKENRLPRSFTTASGSVYTYLEDGRIQRLKTAEGELKQPKDVVVFIPSIAHLKTWVHYQKLPDWIRECDDDMFASRLAGYTHGYDTAVVLMDAQLNQPIKNNAAASQSKQPCLCFVDKQTNTMKFYLPVSTQPNIGDRPFDARFYVDEKGEERQSMHIGNAVIDITF